MSKSGDMTFTLPECPFEAEVQLGTKIYTKDFLLEEVLINLREAFVELSYRKRFDYAFVPHQTRKTTLRYKKTKTG